MLVVCLGALNLGGLYIFSENSLGRVERCGKLKEQQDSEESECIIILLNCFEIYGMNRQLDFTFPPSVSTRLVIKSSV